MEAPLQGNDLKWVALWEVEKSNGDRKFVPRMIKKLTLPRTWKAISELSLHPMMTSDDGLVVVIMTRAPELVTVCYLDRNRFLEIDATFLRGGTICSPVIVDKLIYFLDMTSLQRVVVFDLNQSLAPLVIAHPFSFRRAGRIGLCLRKSIVTVTINCTDQEGWNMIVMEMQGETGELLTNKRIRYDALIGLESPYAVLDDVILLAPSMSTRESDLLWLSITQGTIICRQEKWMEIYFGYALQVDDDYFFFFF